MVPKEITAFENLIRPLMTVEEILEIGKANGIPFKIDGNTVKVVDENGNEFDENGNLYGGYIGLHHARVAQTIRYPMSPELGLTIDDVTFGMSKRDFMETHPEAVLLKESTSADGKLAQTFSTRPNKDEWVQVSVFDDQVNSISRNVDPTFLWQTVGKKAVAERERKTHAGVRAEWAAREHGWPLDHDMDTALREWAKSYNSFTVGPEGWVALAEWLITKSTPDQRHEFVENYNWDHGFVPLMWIASQPTTEMATILTMIWLSEPYYFEDELAEKGFLAPHHHANFDFLYGIKQRVDQGFYKGPTGFFSKFKKPIAYTPDRYIVPQGPQENLHEKQLFSQVMFDPIVGRSVEGLEGDWPIEIN